MAFDVKILYAAAIVHLLITNGVSTFNGYAICLPLVGNSTIRILATHSS